MTSRSKTTAFLHAVLDGIPEALKERRAWMGTRFEPCKDGGLNKPPYRVRAGLRTVKADKTNPNNWATFEEAVDALQRGDVDGIGFVVTARDPFTVIDLDHVIDRDSGEIDAQAAEIVGDFSTYWEFSTRGEGLHGICIGSKPGERCRRDPVELYDGSSGARFLVITGHALSGTREVADCSEAVNALYRRLFPEERKSKTARPRSHGAGQLQGEELLEKARQSRTGARFRKLYDLGDATGFKSASEADFSLINALIFWTAGDADMVVELFKASALFRPPPEKDRGYVERSVKRAVERYSGSYYKPKAVREESTPKQQDILTPYLALLLDPSRWRGQKAAGAYKTYAALVISAVEDGISTDAEELRVGTDVRSIAERAGLRRQTVGGSALPYLQKQKLLTWRRGRGSKAGEFVLKKPELPSDRTTKVYTQYFNGAVYGDGLDALSRLIRMRTGVSKSGNVAQLGEVQKVARLGMVAMFALVSLTTTPRGLNLDELVERTGRRKDHLRNTMQKLIDAQICEEPRVDFYRLAPAFWKAYQRSLIATGIVYSEKKQRQQHDRERRDQKQKLEKGRATSQKFDQNVVDLDAQRRKAEDKKAARQQYKEGDGFLAKEQVEEVMLDAYDAKVERCMRRLEGVERARKERREKKRAEVGGGGGVENGERSPYRRGVMA